MDTVSSKESGPASAAVPGVMPETVGRRIQRSFGSEATRSSRPKTWLRRPAGGLDLPRAVVFVVGLACVGIGTDAIFMKLSIGGSTAVLVVGAGFVLASFFADRLTSLTVGASGISITLASDVRDAGAPCTARLLEKSSVGVELDALASAYALVHSELSGRAGDDLKRARVVLQDRLVERAKYLATLTKLPKDEVRRIFEAGSPVLRVLALGFMQGDPSLAIPSIVREAVGTSRTANEQYHGLRLAELLVPRMSPADRSVLEKVISEDPHIEKAGCKSDRGQLAKRLRDSLKEPQT